MPAYDMIIRNGTIVDGTGAPARVAEAARKADLQGDDAREQQQRPPRGALVRRDDLVDGVDRDPPGHRKHKERGGERGEQVLRHRGERGLARGRDLRQRHALIRAVFEVEEKFCGRALA